MDAMIKSQFWEDSRVEELDANGKLAALWLLTNPGRDLLGFTRTSSRRFIFQTGARALDLEAPCKGLPSSFKAPCEGVYFAANFLRHQFGQGGQISLKNNVIRSAIKKAKTLPSPLRECFLESYPELIESVNGAAAAEAPSEPLRRDQSRAEQSSTEQSRAEEEQGESEGETDRTQAEALVAASPRPDLTVKALHAAQRCLIRHRGAIEFPEILAATREATKATKLWPESERLRYLPTAETFFKDDQWRKAPESWKSRKAARTNKPKPFETRRDFQLLDDDHQQAANS